MNKIVWLVRIHSITLTWVDVGTRDHQSNMHFKGFKQHHSLKTRFLVRESQKEVKTRKKFTQALVES